MVQAANLEFTDVAHVGPTKATCSSARTIIKRTATVLKEWYVALKNDFDNNQRKVHRQNCANEIRMREKEEVQEILQENLDNEMRELAAMQELHL